MKSPCFSSSTYGHIFRTPCGPCRPWPGAARQDPGSLSHLSPRPAVGCEDGTEAPLAPWGWGQAQAMLGNAWEEPTGLHSRAGVLYCWQRWGAPEGWNGVPAIGREVKLPEGGQGRQSQQCLMAVTHTGSNRIRCKWLNKDLSRWMRIKNVVYNFRKVSLKVVVGNYISPGNFDM